MKPIRPALASTLAACGLTLCALAGSAQAQQVQAQQVRRFFPANMEHGIIAKNQ